VSAAYDVAVIGAGANGLVAATALAKAGRRVLVLESESQIGGTWRPIDIASGLAAPLEMESDWIPPNVATLLGVNESDYTSAPGTSVLLDDGEFLLLPPEISAGAAAIRRHSPRDAAKWPEFTTLLRQLSGFLETMYQLPAPDVDSKSVAELSSLLTVGRAFRALGRAGMPELLRVLPMPVQDLADDFLTFEPLKAAVAAAGVRDIRQGPRSGGTSFVLLHYLTGASAGAFRGRRPLRGGPGAFITFAERAAHAAGVTVRTDARVARVDVTDDVVSGVTLASGESIPASVVLSTADPSSTLLGMVDPVWLDPEFVRAVSNIRYRGVTAYVSYAVERVPDLPTGVISLSSSTNAIERPFDASKYGEASPRPHIELTLRPDARSLIARVQYIPFTLRDGAWDAARKGALANLVSAEIARAIPKFSGMVRECRVFTPPDLAKRFGVHDGAFTHGEMGLDQILFMRPVAGYGRHAMPIPGLYLGGAGTHPGPGVAGGPGLLAARQVLADGKKRK
jgi:phytoene dehydrogenase-like protein